MRTKRERRQITVDGEVYGWVLSPDDGYMVLIVRLLNRPGQRLLAYLEYKDIWVEESPGIKRSTGHRVVTPRLVRKIILDAQTRGWEPATVKPPEFRITVED